MNILMLGGTGAMGVHLAELLAREGRSVYVTSRNARDSKTNIIYIQGNAQDDLFLSEVLNKRWDVIVDFMVYTTDIFKDRISSLLAATDQYIYISSSRVYANSDKPITEDSPRLLDVSLDNEFLSTDEYSLSKARQENLLFDSHLKNWTIIRPYITYSDERLQLGVLEKEAWLYRALHKRPIVFSTEINTKVTTLTYGLDVAKGISAIIGESSALGEAFHITSSKSIYWNEVLDIYTNVLADYFGDSPKVVLQNFEDFNAWHPAKYQIEYDRLYNRKFDNSKIEKYIDTSTFVDSATGLKLCLEQFLKQPKFLKIDLRTEAIKDKQLGVRASLIEWPSFKQNLKYFILRNTHFNC
jgi:nucleoside-diphosphate-sugar epimerase